MAGNKGVVLFPGGEKRLDTVQLKGHLDSALQFFNKGGEGDLLRILRLQSRAHGGEKVGVFRVHHHVRRQLQGADKGLF